MRDEDGDEDLDAVYETGDKDIDMPAYYDDRSPVKPSTRRRRAAVQQVSSGLL